MARRAGAARNDQDGLIMVDLKSLDALRASLRNGNFLPFVTVGFNDGNYICDGVDDYQEIQRAIAEISSNYNFYGGGVRLQRGYYDFGTGGKITIPEYVSLQGENFPGSGNTWALGHFDATKSQCARLKVTNVTDAAVQMKSGSKLKNVQFYYPNQETRNAGNSLSPLVYPAAIKTIASDSGAGPANVNIENVNIGNAYIGIEHTTKGIGLESGALIATNIRGYPLNMGVNINNSFDSCILRDLWFSPGEYPGSTPGTVFQTYVLSNAKAFNVVRTDNGLIDHCMALGYLYHTYIDGGNVVNTQNITVQNCIMDSCYNGLFADNHREVKVTDCAIQASPWGSYVAASGNEYGITLGSGVEKGYLMRNKINSQGHGIVCYPGKVTITENEILQFGTAAHSTNWSKGIILFGGDSVVNNNRISHYWPKGSQPVNDYSFGLVFDAVNGSDTRIGIVSVGNYISYCMYGIWIRDACTYGVCIGNSIDTCDNSHLGGTHMDMAHNTYTNCLA